MHDLLQDPLIGVLTPTGPQRASLPELLAALARGEVDGYTGLRAHQTDPWHVFTVQIAASVLARRLQVVPVDSPRDPAFWREGLLELADAKASAWELVVEDLTQPAFLQHPLASMSELTRFDPKHPKATTPDELDVLVTAKNHDVKMARIRPLDAEAWMFALLAYQTTSGFLGLGNYGSVRMNGGFGSRPIISAVASLHPSRRFREELDLVVSVREQVLARRFGYRDRGIALTWLEAWDRSGHQYMPTDLEPWFIEACRPVRLVTTGNTIVALGTTSKARQIGPKNLENGDVGDPWIPINTGDKKKGRSALTLGAKGFTPETLTSLLFQQDFELTPLQISRPGTGDVWFTGSVLARGQGSTEGFHRFALPIPSKARPRLFDQQARQTLGKLAQALLGDAKAAETALRMALFALCEGGPEKVDFEADSIKKWIAGSTQSFAQRWGEAYFEHLWRVVDQDEDTVRADWHAHLEGLARRVLDDAQARVPLPHNRRWRSTIRAHDAFAGMLRKNGWSHADRPVSSEIDV